MKLYKKLCWLWLGLTTCLLISVGCFNYWIDSASVYGIKNNDFLTIFEAIKKQKSISGFPHANDRLFHQSFIKFRSDTPDIIALGSSRIMLLDSKYFSKKTFFNHGLARAGFNDYLGILGTYLQSRQELPKAIIFGLDAWVFNISTDLRYQDLSEGLNLAKTQILKNYSTQTKESSNTFFKLKEMFSWNYTLRNFEFFNSPTHHQLQAIDNCSQTDSNCLNSDGSQKNAKDLEQRQKNEIQQLASAYTKDPICQLGNYSKLQTDDFLLLMDFLQSKNIKVVFYLTPYHPIVYRYLQKNAKCKMVLEAENFIRSYAKEHNIDVIGSYNPSVLGLNATDFYDGIHLKENGFDKVFQPQQAILKKLERSF